MCQHNLYTIGYAGFLFEEFLKALKYYKIKALVDVRSSPYSTLFHDFNRDRLNLRLKKEGISYLFFGEAFGARPKDFSLYINLKVDFEKIAASRVFIDHCQRLYNGLAKYPVCLMCAEKDPLFCHRAILVAHSFRNIYATNKIFHIRYDASEESQDELDQRILAAHGLSDGSLFNKDASENLNEAYWLRGRKISFSEVL